MVGEEVKREGSKESVESVEKQIREDLQINEEELDGELVTHSTKQYYWGSMWARALRKARSQKLMLEHLEARLSKEFRDYVSTNSPEVRVTEKMLKEYIWTHPEYLNEVKTLTHLDYIADVLNVARLAFEQRGRMLLELARQKNVNRAYEREFENMKMEFERREAERLAEMKDKLETKKGGKDE